MNLPFARLLLCAVTLTLVPLLPAGIETERQYLSGRGPADAVPWEFTVSAGRRAGEKTTIPVPSQWEQHGFGAYEYGEIKPKQTTEQGFYRVKFHVPAAWEGQRVRLGFDGVMTDTLAKVNGQPAGPVHQGGFTQFRYDVTTLVKYGAENVLEVEVSKISADALTERAERGGDYWVFGGIYRSVWLETVPARSIDHVAINAQADGSITADVTLNMLRDKVRPEGPALQPETLEAQIFDAAQHPVGAPFTVKIPAGGAGRLRLASRVAQPLLWTAETPNLYTLKVARVRGGAVLHTTTTRFGFRTIEVREGDGIYVNGQRVVLKGVNRHSFRPDTGRALTREDCYADVALIRAMNMNDVRMSHYPPDEAFLEACDEIGLYVMDELSGWQASHGTPIGRLLVRELVERDVNHPSIIFWDNGNEGGWNRDLDGDFSLYDPQQRTVLHPWDPFGGIDTKHYTGYADHVNRLKGPNLVMPTEILHALYDGGAGAGLDDYWQATLASRFGAGLFIWDYADEAIARTDRGGKVDPYSTFAPDGIVGPRFEKEGSYHTLRRVWSPVQIDEPALDAKFDGTLQLRNGYDFTSLAACRVEWSWLRFDGAKQSVIASGGVSGPAVAPHAKGALKLDLPANWRDADALAVSVKDPRGEVLWTWTWATPALAERTTKLMTAASTAKSAAKAETRNGAVQLTAGQVTATFNASTGLLTSLRSGGKAYALGNGPRLAYARPAKDAPVSWLPWRDAAPANGSTFSLAEPQLASVLELEFEVPRGMPYIAAHIELSPDGNTWHTIYDASRRPGDGGSFVFPPQRVAAVRLTKLFYSDGSAAVLKNARLGYAAGRFPADDASRVTVTSGNSADGAWLESRGGNTHFKWTLSAAGTLRLDYDYALEGTFIYHGVTFDHPEESMKSLRWLGEGPYRVWQNRLHGTWLGVHETTRHVLQPGESFQYPEFEGFFAGIRWARLDTAAGPLGLVVDNPNAYLRVGTSRISHPQTTVDFPAGDLSFLHAIPGMGSKFKAPDISGPHGEAGKASGTYKGSIVFFAGEVP